MSQGQKSFHCKTKICLQAVELVVLDAASAGPVAFPWPPTVFAWPVRSVAANLPFAEEVDFEIDRLNRLYHFAFEEQELPILILKQ